MNEMKRYDFDEVIDRRGTGCVKYDAMGRFFGRDDLTPLWVADMDFRTPDFVVEALRRRLDHEVLGYASPTEGYWRAAEGWLRRRYHIESRRDELHFIPGIVAGIAFALQALTRPGDRVLVTTPVYPPFLNLPAAGGRLVEASPLRVRDGRFEIDFDDFEARAARCRCLILANPHNPGGTVWGADTLRRIADICSRHGVVVIADEIHADMTLPGHSHASFSTTGEAARNCSITFVAPSKTFNIAGLGSSMCYCPNDELRKAFYGYLDGYELANGNIFAFAGAEAAFAQGEEWLVQLLDYLQGNVRLLADFLSEQMPEVSPVLPEASFLAWIDFSGTGLGREELKERIYNRARIALNDGSTFGGKAYERCFRINLGAPRAVIAEALDRLKAAF